MQNSLIKSKQDHFIVTNDFVKRLTPKDAKCPQVYPVLKLLSQESIVVKRKKQIMRDLLHKNTDFFDMDQQLSKQKQNLYRRMSVVLQKQKMYSLAKQSINPFQSNKSIVKSKYNQRTQIAKLVHQVQPYWIKNYSQPTNAFVKL